MHWLDKNPQKCLKGDCELIISSIVTVVKEDDGHLIS